MIYGTERRIQDVFHFIKGDENDQFIDFNKIIPEPEYSTYDEWYEWRSKNWLTKWNAHDQEMINDHSISFYTAWSPPIPVIEALSEMFPDIVFKISYWIEAFMIGRFVVKNMKVLVNYHI